MVRSEKLLGSLIVSELSTIQVVALFELFGLLGLLTATLRIIGDVRGRTVS